MSPQEWIEITEIAQNCKDFIESGKGVLFFKSRLIKMMEVSEKCITFYFGAVDLYTSGNREDDIMMILNGQDYQFGIERINNIKGVLGTPKLLADLFKEEW